jgi:galactofuranose transport system substrate-binding protein
MPRMLTYPLASLLALFCLALGACDRKDDSSSSSSSASPSTASTTQSTGGGTARSGKQITVGFSQIGAESAWRTAETKSFDSEAPNRGIYLKNVDAQGSQDKQVQTLNTFVTQRVDAIVLAPKTEDGWVPVLKKIKQANIPVILVDRGVNAPEDLYATLIASDFVAEGRRAGEWLAKKTGGKCMIAQLEGSTGSAPAKDRARGFAEAIKPYGPGMQIIMTQNGEFSRTGGKQVMEAFLKSPQGKQIQAVYAHNDDMALGAIQAIEEAGRKPGSDILVVCVDGGKAALEEIARGRIACAVECSPRLAPQAFDAVNDVLAGKTLPKKQVVQDRIFDENNVKDVLAKGDYWE